MKKNVLNKISTVGVVATIGVLVSLSGVFDSMSTVDSAYGYGYGSNNHSSQGSLSTGSHIYDVEDDKNVTTDGSSSSETKKDTDKKDTDKKETTTTEKSETVKNDRIVKVNGDKVYTVNKNTNEMSKKIVDADMTKFVSKFKDTSNSKYKNDIERLEKTGVIYGTTDTTFEPSKKISRAEFLAIVLKSNGYDVSKAPKTLPFNDVDLASWQAKVINAALENGFIAGDKDASGNRVFRANDPISKIEAMAITLSIRDFEVPSNFKHSYTDAAAKWQNKILNQVEYLGLDTEEGNKFNPNSTIKRDTMAHFIVSVLRLY